MVITLSIESRGEDIKYETLFDGSGTSISLNEPSGLLDLRIKFFSLS